MKRIIQVRVVYDHLAGWAYWRRAVAIQKFAPDDMAISIQPHMNRFDDARHIDVLYDMNYGHVATARRDLLLRFPRAKMAVAFNCGWPRRPEYLAQCLKHAEVTVMNNEEYYVRAGKKANMRCIPNGVDTSMFKPIVPIADRPRKFLWMGSDYHRELKGFNLVVGAAQRLAKHGIESDICCIDTDRRGTIKPQESMPAWYNDGRVFVCASDNEGTPNPALEAAACGCAVVTTHVGNMPELITNRVNGLIIDRSVDAIVAGVLEADHEAERLTAAMAPVIARWDWAIQVQPFYQLFRDLCA